MYKNCAGCKRDLPTSEFYARTGGVDGLRGKCKECWNLQSREWQGMNPDRVNELARDRRALDPEHAREMVTRWRRENPVATAASNLQQNAARRAKIKEGRVTAEDLAQLLEDFDNCCFYCYGPFEHWDHYIPLSKGGTHSVDNLVPSCAPCNLSKHAKIPLLEWVSRFAPRHEADDFGIC